LIDCRGAFEASERPMTVPVVSATASLEASVRYHDTVIRVIMDAW
jgi:hypothetical protein